MMKHATFTQKDVSEWCERHGDDNPLHEPDVDPDDTPFGQTVVPGIMLLDEMSGMLTNLTDEDETVILAGVTAARFRDPVLIDETVSFELEIVEEAQMFTAVRFEAHVEERGSFVAGGEFSITIQ